MVDYVCDRDVNFVVSYAKTLPAFALKDLVDAFANFVKEVARLGSNKDDVRTPSPGLWIFFFFYLKLTWDSFFFLRKMIILIYFFNFERKLLDLEGDYDLDYYCIELF